MKNTLLTLFLLNCLLFAQEQTTHSFWAEVGTGVNFLEFTDSHNGFNLYGSLNYEIENNNFSLSYLHSSEFSMFVRPEEYIESIELKYGRSIHFSMRGLGFPIPFLLIINRNFDYSLVGKVGISYNESRKRTALLANESFDSSYNSKITNGFGLPVEIELREQITSFIGMGFSFYANFNEVKNFSGVNFNIHLGKF